MTEEALVTRLLSVFPCLFSLSLSLPVSYSILVSWVITLSPLLSVNQAGSPGASDDPRCLRFDLVIIPDSCL